MSKLAKNSLAVGLATLIATAGLSFSANAAVDTKSHASARFVTGTLGTTSLDDVVKLEGTKASNPANDPEDTSDQLNDDNGPNANPLSVTVLKAIPINFPGGIDFNLADILSPGAGTAAANQYSRAGSTSTADAYSGAVADTGAILNPDNTTFPSNATLSLTGGQLDMANLTSFKLTTGALAGSARLSGGEAVRDYQIGTVKLDLGVPLLADITKDIDGAVNTGRGNINDVSLSLDDVCPLVGDTLNVSLATLKALPVVGPLIEAIDLATRLPADLNLCKLPDALPTELQNQLKNVVELNATGLGTVNSGLTNFTKDGVTVNFATGKVTIDLEKVLEASDPSLNIDELGPNTDLVKFLADDLIAGKVKTTLKSAFADIIKQVTDNVGVEVKVGGNVVIPKVDISGLTAPLQTAVDGLSTALDAIGTPIDEALATLTTNLQELLALTANVQPDKGVSTGSGPATTVDPAVLGKDYSVAALKIAVARGNLASVKLADALVGLDAADVADDNQSDTQADAGTQADTDTQADTQSDTDAQADNGDVAADTSDADAVADSDSQADADVTTTLPSTGAPNLMPFWILGLALLLFGGAVLVNERRRLGKI